MKEWTEHTQNTFKYCVNINEREVISLFMARSLPWEYFASCFILKTMANYGKGHTPSQEAPDWKKQSHRPIIKPDHPVYCSVQQSISFRCTCMGYFVHPNNTSNFLTVSFHKFLSINLPVISMKDKLAARLWYWSCFFKFLWRTLYWYTGETLNKPKSTGYRENSQTGALYSLNTFSTTW